MRVREADAADIDTIVRHASDFAIENYPLDPPSKARLTEVVSSSVDGDDFLAAVLETDSGDYAGVFLGALVPNIVSGRRMLVEVLFVLPVKHRGHGKRLLKFAEQWASGRGCASIFLSHPVTAERAGKAFEAWGYRACERHYRKELVCR